MVFTVVGFCVCEDTLVPISGSSQYLSFCVWSLERLWDPPAAAAAAADNPRRPLGRY